MQQTVLITAVRGADTLNKHHISKYLLRWYRRCVLISAFDRCVLTDPFDPRGGVFLGPICAHSLEEVAAKYFSSVDEVPHHFHLHLIHAAEVLGYKHPDEAIRSWWNGFYLAAAGEMHLEAESEEVMDARLGDNLDEWQQLGGHSESVTERLSQRNVPAVSGTKHAA
jgi:hypothetical protein